MRFLQKTNNKFKYGKKSYKQSSEIITPFVNLNNINNKQPYISCNVYLFHTYNSETGIYDYNPNNTGIVLNSVIDYEDNPLVKYNKNVSKSYIFDQNGGQLVKIISHGYKYLSIGLVSINSNLTWADEHHCIVKCGNIKKNIITTSVEDYFSITRITNIDNTHSYYNLKINLQNIINDDKLLQNNEVQIKFYTGMLKVYPLLQFNEIDIFGDECITFNNIKNKIRFDKKITPKTSTEIQYYSNVISAFRYTTNYITRQQRKNFEFTLHLNIYNNPNTSGNIFLYKELFDNNLKSLKPDRISLICNDNDELYNTNNITYPQNATICLPKNVKISNIVDNLYHININNKNSEALRLDSRRLPKLYLNKYLRRYINYSNLNDKDGAYRYENFFTNYYWNDNYILKNFSGSCISPNYALDNDIINKNFNAYYKIDAGNTIQLFNNESLHQLFYHETRDEYDTNNDTTIQNDCTNFIYSDNTLINLTLEINNFNFDKNREIFLHGNKFANIYINGNNDSPDEKDFIIRRRMFAHCPNLRHVVFNNIYITRIHCEAFANCYNLENIYFPSVTNIILHNNIFRKCTKLKAIYFDYVPKIANYNKFYYKIRDNNNGIDISRDRPSYWASSNRTAQRKRLFMNFNYTKQIGKYYHEYNDTINIYIIKPIGTGANTAANVEEFNSLINEYNSLITQYPDDYKHNKYINVVYGMFPTQ